MASRSVTKGTRPGVDASKRLSKISSVPVWDAIDRQYDRMIKMKGGDKLSQLDEARSALGKRLRSEKNPYLCLDDLFQIVEWKFGKGKPRHALWKHLKSIQENDLKTLSMESFERAQKGDVRGAVEELSKLSGVGPATASAILSIYNPDYFTFMDDEVIEALYDDGKRGYTIKIYLEVNSKCQKIARDLNQVDKTESTTSWTCHRVGRALWTASQICATGGEDLTLMDDDDTGNTKRLSLPGNTSKNSKRPRHQNTNSPEPNSFPINNGKTRRTK
jgi:hypothetical protein